MSDPTPPRPRSAAATLAKVIGIILLVVGAGTALFLGSCFLLLATS